MTKKNVELLSPAGSYETLLAVMAAGADAVYIGGEKFSARAYATNLNKENILRAIDIGHMNDKKVILAVNTLMKNKEIENELYEYLLPYYEAGLDAVIVQDMGVALFIRTYFPNLPVHASTQTTICAANGVKYMDEIGVSRCVLARELSLSEIRHIKETVPSMELECFVHGALCYSYSGQCLMSSILGGRSGNRGRCAGPCRLNYEVFEDGKKINKKDEDYPLSLKDLNAIELLPELIEAGVYSFKLEGRMKSSAYAAGVVSIYRKYIDMYMEGGKENYHVSEEDKKRLFALGNRCGFTDGYFRKKNGRDMVTLHRPNHTRDEDNDSLTFSADALKKKLKANVHAVLGEPLKIEVSDGEICGVAYGNICEAAKSKAVTFDVIKDKVVTSGDELVAIDGIDVDLKGELFISMSELKNVRRSAIEDYKKKILERFKRPVAGDGDYIKKAEISDSFNYANTAGCAPESISKNEEVCVTVQSLSQLEAVKNFDIDRVYIDAFICNEKNKEEVLNALKGLKNNGEEVYFALPYAIRKNYIDYLTGYIKAFDFDGYLVRNFDGLNLLKEMGVSFDKIILDHSLYTFSNHSIAAFKKAGYSRFTVPYELNKGEIRHRFAAGSEMVIYGRIPLMISAGCLNNTYHNCDKKAHNMSLKDRYGIIFPVKNNCAFCYNVLYNSKSLNLTAELSEIKKIGISSFRFEFTTEEGASVKDILSRFFDGRKLEAKEGFTFGHYKRGVE